MNTYNIYDLSNTEIELLATIQAENIKEVAEYIEKDKFYNRYVWLKIENEKNSQDKFEIINFCPF